MRPGEKVKVRVFGGKTVRRVVVEQIENTVVICRPEEWYAAARENRRPEGVGFPIWDVRLKKMSESAKV